MMTRTGSFFLISGIAIGLAGFGAQASAAKDEARVTRIVHEVKLLPPQEKPRPAALNDKVSDGSGVRTGSASRSELTFVDLTIERLGANTVFSFNGGGRSVRLDSGSVLLRVPKDSGGANMSTSAVSVGITGTTVILESARNGRNKLIVLEGGARISLIKNRNESVYVRGGQMEDVPPGATKLPPPVNIDIGNLMKTHPLITDFGPLPSRDLIMATASNPPVYQGQPADQPPGPGPGFVPPIIPIIGGLGIGGGGVGFGSGGSHGHTGRGHPTRTTTTTTTKTPQPTDSTTGVNRTVTGAPSHATVNDYGKANATATPPRKKKTSKSY